MNLYNQILLFSIIILLCYSESYSQESINSTGGDVYSSSGSVSYSIGQVEYKSFKDTSYSSTDGVQQVYDIYEVSIVSDRNDEHTITVFPNPSTEYIRIMINGNQTSEYSYVLSDYLGNSLKTDNIDNQILDISLGGFIPSTYILNILYHGQIIKTFKIIKK